MKMYFRIFAAAVILVSIYMNLYSQEVLTDRVSVAFSDPSRAGFLKVSLINGSITVTGYDGNDVLVEAKVRSKRYSHDRKNDAARGMKRLAITSTGLTVEEQDNIMSVSAASHVRAIDVTIKVPKRTSLKLNAINNGNIFVENMTGEIELHNVNGKIEAYKIYGSVVANTTNGKVTVTFEKIDPKKPMSFISFNGRVDVTFPENVKADVKMKSVQGDIYSDFDIEIEQGPKLIQEDSRERGGKFKVTVENTIYGKLNGGGPLYHFSTYNGSIYIRKAN